METFQPMIHLKDYNIHLKNYRYFLPKEIAGIIECFEIALNKTFRSYIHLKDYRDYLPKEVADIIKCFEIALIGKECGHIVGKQIYKLSRPKIGRFGTYDFSSLWAVCNVPLSSCFVVHQPSSLQSNRMLTLSRS